MKKNLLTKLRGLLSAVLLTGLGATATNAQTAASYMFTPLPGTYTPLSGGTEVFSIYADDASSPMLPIGFTFNFCGVDYTEVKVNSNGWLSFADATASGWEMYGNEDPVFNVPTMTPVIWAMWDDQDGYNGSAHYTVEGTSPNQVFTMEWRNWDWYLGQFQTLSYQIKLYETSNVIEIIYNQEPGQLTTWFSESGTIGIANDVNDFQTLSDWSTNPTSSSTTFYTSIFDKPASGQIYRWAPPLPCAGIPDAGEAVATVTSHACEGSSDLFLTNNTIATQLEYQWQYSTDGTTWFDLGSVQTTAATNTGTISETTQFRAIVTCVPSGESATSDPVTVTVGAPVAGGTLATPPLVCNGGSSLLSATGSTTAGVDYQWQSSTDGVSFSPIGGANSATYTTPGLTTPMYYNVILSCSFSGAPATTTSAMVDVLPTTAPAVNPASLSVNCGDPAPVSATPSPGATIRWYDVPTGGTELAIGNNVNLYPSADQTYYAEITIPTQVTGINTADFQVVDHNTLTGDDRGGIAISNNFVYYTGDNNTGKFNKIDLSSPVSLSLRDGFFGSSGQLWQLGNGFTSGGSYQGDDDVDMLYGLDEDLNLTGNDVALDQTIYLSWGSVVAPGDGYVLLYDGISNVYHVDITTGAVTTLTTTVSGDFIQYWPENWAAYGWAESDGSSYKIVYREDWPNDLNISKYDINSGTVTPMQSFSNLSDMAAIVYDGSTNRMYFHYEGSGEFGGSTETIGWVGATVNPGCSNNDRTPVQVTVEPITATISPTGTVNICINSTQTLTAMTGASYQWFFNGAPIPGATNQTYAAGNAGDYHAEVTTNAGCVGLSDPTTITVSTGQTASVVIASTDTIICGGESVTFTATPTNGGTGTAYQWTVNGANVGTNSATYTSTTLADGDDVNVIMTVGTGICTSTPTATSNTIVMDVTTNVAPTVTINADPGSTACVDDIISFTITITNGGTTPTFLWTVNGSTVGTNSPNYTAPAGSLNTGDVVSVNMTSNATCALPVGVTQNMTMTIDALTTPAVTIAADQTVICQGTMVTFTATDNAPGGTYQWFVDGVPSGPNNATYTFAPDPGAVVTLDFIPPAAGCYENIVVSSNAIPMDVTPGLPTMATASAVPAAGQGTTVTVSANLFNFNTDFTIDWYIDGVLYTTTTVPYMSFTKGPGTEVVYAVVTNSGAGCYLVATTNDVTIETWNTSVANSAARVNIEIYPNPFGNTLTIKGLADGDQVYMLNALGQTIQQWNLDKVTPEQQLKINDFAAGSYLINIRDKDGGFKEMKKLQKL